MKKFFLDGKVNPYCKVSFSVGLKQVRIKKWCSSRSTADQISVMDGWLKTRMMVIYAMLWCVTIIYRSSCSVRLLLRSAGGKIEWDGVATSRDGGGPNWWRMTSTFWILFSSVEGRGNDTHGWLQNETRSFSGFYMVETRIWAKEKTLPHYLLQF